MKLGWIDSHAHIISERFEGEFETLKQNAIAHGVNKVCIICGNLHEIEVALSLVEKDDMFDLAVGVHPGNVKDISIGEFNAMMEYLHHPKVKFVGEIGLDYYWDQSFNELQKEMFAMQIGFANKFDLPIIIHMRESSDDVYEIIKKHPVNKTGVAHCFTEDVTSAKRFVELGYYIGIGGIVTFKNGDNIRALVKELPFDKLLSETDSPYLTPVPYRGKRNEPAYVSYVGEEIAKLKNLPIDTVQKQLKDNYEKLSKRSV
ncbi:MAG TPA: TatD family hydrolase [Erysipelothrix sp.]|nr:TatD family hydrolase [Erysipelothrix sp.]